LLKANHKLVVWDENRLDLQENPKQIKTFVTQFFPMKLRKEGGQLKSTASAIF
jgi:hypothetical protein